jgi:hypothetical protein
MVGIVVILLLGSLAWSAVGAMFSALGEATAVFSPGRPTPTKLAVLVVTPTQPPSPQFVGPTATAATRSSGPDATPAVGITPGSAATLLPARADATPLPSPTVEATVEPTPAVTPTPAASGRAPWILLPQPAPDGRVSPGPLGIEARGRGDAPITAIRLELDGAALPVSLEQRDDSTWRGSASVQVQAGHHAVRAVVTDNQGRGGSFRWNFDAAP